MNELFFLGMSSGCGIGGIQLTEILLSSSYRVVNYKKPLYIVLFCREAMQRCSILHLPHPKEINS